MGVPLPQSIRKKTWTVGHIALSGMSVLPVRGLPPQIPLHRVAVGLGQTESQ